MSDLNTIGYVKLHRPFFSHWLWEEVRALSKAEAFLDLLQLAAFAPTKRVIQGKLVSLSVGELVASERFLELRWKWSRTKVRQFLVLLESDRMLDRRKDQGETVLKLSNYGKYAGADHEKKTTDQTSNQTTGEPGKDQQPDHAETKYKKDKKDKKERAERSLAPTALPSKPEPIEAHTDDWGDDLPTEAARDFDAIQAKINRLHPSWKKRPHFSRAEQEELLANSRIFFDITPQDWALLSDYIAALVDPEWKLKTWQPDNRSMFLRSVTDVLTHADNWQRECKRRGVATGIDATQTATP